MWKGTCQISLEYCAFYQYVNMNSCVCFFFFSKLSINHQFSCLSHVRLFATPWTAARPGLPIHHQFPASPQIHIHWVGDAIQPSNPLSSPFPPALNLSQHQGPFKWVNSLHKVAKYWSFSFYFKTFLYIYLVISSMVFKYMYMYMCVYN